MHRFTFQTAKTILYGPGISAEIGKIAADQLGKRVLFVTDPGLIKAHLVDPALGALMKAGVEVSVFDGVVADPPEAVVMEGVAAAKAFRADAVIGLGGGSSLDVAKLVALIAASGERLADVYGVGNAKGPRLPLLLAPTTAGTGSEVTPIAVVTTSAHEKKGVVSQLLYPDVALLDPELTHALPHHVTAATGVDAMVHAIEAYSCINPNNNPLSKNLAKQALRLLGDGIRSAVREGSHPEARGQMLLGSMLAGQAFANSPVGAVHALAYPIGGHFHIAHGLSNALVLPHVMRFNAPACGDSYAELAPHAFPYLAETAFSHRAEAFAEALAHLMEEIGLPLRLRDVGIPHDAVAMMAAEAMKQTRLLVNNPRPITQADAAAIYEAAW